MATSTLGARAHAEPAPSRVSPAPATERTRDGFGLVAKAVAVGFWGTLITLIVSAAVAPGFAILALLPLLGMPYLLFCFVALTGDRNVE